MIKNIMKNIGPKKEIKTIPFNPKDLEYVEADGTKRKFTPEEMLAELNEMKAEEEKDSKDTTRIEGEIKGLKEYMGTLKKPAIDKKKFIEMVYDYGASGDKTLEGLADNQKQAIASAWSTFKAEDEEGETDEKFGSFYSDFLGK